jgi:hypothetical protein
MALDLKQPHRQQKQARRHRESGAIGETGRVTVLVGAQLHRKIKEHREGTIASSGEAAHSDK